jgi:hypothetical protein
MRRPIAILLACLLAVTTAGAANERGAATGRSASTRTASTFGRSSTTRMPLDLAGWNPTKTTSATAFLWVNGDSGTVSSWTDQSTGNNPLLQATGNKQPTIVANALNGKSVFAFTGGQFMQTAAFTAKTGAIELFAVLKFTSAFGAATYFLDGQSANAFALFRASASQITLVVSAGSSTLTSPVDTTGWHIYNIRSPSPNGVGTTIQIDDRTLKTGYGGTPSNNLTKVTVAIAGDSASLPSAIQVRQLVYLNGLLSAIERATMLRYLRADSGLN